MLFDGLADHDRRDYSDSENDIFLRTRAANIARCPRDLKMAYLKGGSPQFKSFWMAPNHRKSMDSYLSAKRSDNENN